ncbi:hypothetical protein SAMN05421504_101809 [Amycolatopsis xylanica]|uniref:Uncharacterized protein n=1 Tax=Amycolatopsis xylanica TaxID=589385 RepID=A0A1H2U7M5_9PSEU|nr:hypothetical protein [Amycolatopsis xylanica]SDW52146.1 hypothetical protein SAMN05421504_101809 [Amycolatopsis xylanica]
MDEFEQRVRATLGELADSVPASPHAWAEQNRRRGRKQRSRRETVLVAVAASVVLIAAVLVPSMLIRQDREQTPASQGPVPGPVYVPEQGAELLAGPFVLTTSVHNGQTWNAVAYLVSGDKATRSPMLCTWFGAAGTAIAGAGPGSTCYPLPADKTPQPAVAGHGLPDGAAASPPHGVWVFVTTSRVASLRVYNRDGGMSKPRLVGGGGGYSLFSGEYTDPGWFDAYDAHDVFIGSGVP